MPTQKDFGSKTSMDRGGSFIQLKGKGEKIQFRLIAPPFYDGKHFQKDGDKWKVTMCPKIMSESECDSCEEYYKLYREAKNEEDKNKKEELLKKARYYKAKVTFYYPILDRSDETAKILKTTLSVRLKIDDRTNMGFDVRKNDWILMRTEKPGADFYALEPVDSTLSKPLTEKEQEQIKLAQSWNMEEKTGTKLNESSEEFVKETDVEEVGTENVDPKDIPF